MFKRVYKFLEKWLSERYPFNEAKDFISSQLTKPLPPHIGYFHTFGSIALFLLINQIVTGILLMVYYRADTEGAFESVKFIMTKVHFGWLIRGLHAWGANMMILFVILHMLRTFFMGAYKKPREITWVIGVMLLGITFTFGFTGYLLPWNQLSYWATTVGTEVAGAIPLFGHFLKYLLRGGEAVGAETLARFFDLHVIVLPWVAVGLMSAHIFLMRVQGLASLEPVGVEPIYTEKDGIPFFPDHTLTELSIFSLFFLGLLTIVVLIPVELGEKANPFVTPEGIKPEWYFLPTYQLLKYFPKLLGIITSMLPILVLFLLPFIDRKNPERRPSKRRLSVSLGIAAVMLAVFFGIVGHFSESNIKIGSNIYHIDLYGIPHRLKQDKLLQESSKKGGSDRNDSAQGERSIDGD